MVNVDEMCIMASDIVNQISNVELDFTMESLHVVEENIQYVRRLHMKELVNDTVCWNMSVSLGVYCGEVYLKDKLGAMGYAWKDNAEGIPVVADEKNAMNPITKIYKKLMEI